jgi:hypothetical protein
VKEYLEFLDELTGGSFFAEAIERKDSRSVAFQELITVRAAFVEETEPSGLRTSLSSRGSLRRLWGGNWWYWIPGSSRPDTIRIPSPRSLRGEGSWPLK